MQRKIIFALLLALIFLRAGTGQGQDAAALRAQASSEMNQEKQVQLLCKAADLDPKNKEYRNECEVRKAALINSDRQALKTALDASDAGQTSKAKRYAKYVSSFDADTHHQAEQLLAKLGGTDAPVSTSPTPLVAAPAATSQNSVLAQAVAAYEAGNLSAARSEAQSVTDPSIQPAANRLLADIDRYRGYVSSGQKYEQAKEYAEAERSYHSALEMNVHVGADDLTGRTQRMHQMAANPKVPVIVATKETPKVAKPVAEVSPEERKKRLLDESSQALSRNDLDTAGRKFKQLLDLDPTSSEAKQGLMDVSERLNKDPIRLEKTLRDAIAAFYSSHFEDAESGLNRYLGADNGKKKGAAYFYLGATETTLSLLDAPSKRANHSKDAQGDFRQARSAGYLPVQKYVSVRVLDVWKSSGL